jgi:hypothetical protein
LAVDGALTLAGGKVDPAKLLIDLKKHGGMQSDLARIFEGRQSVRMLSLLRADLEGISKTRTKARPATAKSCRQASARFGKGQCDGWMPRGPRSQTRRSRL